MASPFPYKATMLHPDGEKEVWGVVSAVGKQIRFPEGKGPTDEVSARTVARCMNEAYKECVRFYSSELSGITGSYIVWMLKRKSLNIFREIKIKLTPRR